MWRTCARLVPSSAPRAVFDAELAKSDTIEIVVQIKGKNRARIDVPANSTKEQLEAAARTAVAAQLEGRDVRKVIVVPGRLVNIVAQ